MVCILGINRPEVTKSVLLIEDSKLELYRYVNFLKDLSFDVTGVSTAKEAKLPSLRKALT